MPPMFFCCNLSSIERMQWIKRKAIGIAFAAIAMVLDVGVAFDAQCLKVVQIEEQGRITFMGFAMMCLQSMAYLDPLACSACVQVALKGQGTQSPLGVLPPLGGIERVTISETHGATPDSQAAQSSTLSRTSQSQ